jgi:cell division protein FtsB
MAENVKQKQNNDFPSTLGVNGDNDSGEVWELEDIATNKDMFAKLTARVAALEAEITLTRAQKGF